MRPEERENQRYSAGSVNPIEEEEKILLSFLPDGSGKSLLDVGCGIGSISLELQKKGFCVKGVDFSEIGVSKCIERGLDARVCDVDKNGLPFGDKSFDIVWAGDIIEHVFDPIFLLEETCRVLKDNGSLLATIPNDFYFKRRWRIFKTGRSIQSSVYRKLRQCKHHTFFSWELLEYMLGQAGLTVVKYTSIYRNRRTKVCKQYSNRVMGRLFGRKFIFSVCKKS